MKKSTPLPGTSASPVNIRATMEDSRSESRYPCMRPSPNPAIMAIVRAMADGRVFSGPCVLAGRLPRIWTVKSPITDPITSPSQARPDRWVRSTIPIAVTRP